MGFKRRVYFDHEGVYRRFREEGRTGWDPPGEDAMVALRDYLASRFAPTTPGRVLDLGCGGGEVSIHMARLGWEVTGIDFSETAIEMARENVAKAGVEVELIVGDITKPLSIDAGQFSLVLDNHVRHCLIGHSDRMAFMANAFDALQSGGKIFSESQSTEGYIDYAFCNEVDPQTGIDKFNTRYYGRLQEYLNEFDESGFRVEHLKLEQNPTEGPLGGADVVIYAFKP